LVASNGNAACVNGVRNSGHADQWSRPGFLEIARKKRARWELRRGSPLASSPPSAPKRFWRQDGPHDPSISVRLVMRVLNIGIAF
jgi:hypothetical protein